jgi:hypothetical protein
MSTIDPTFLAALAARGQSPPLEISTSWLDTWHRCDRRYFYRYIRGLVPKSVNENMVWGTFFHRIIQEYYRSLQNHAREDAALHNAQLIAERCTLVENKYHGDTPITFDAAKREAIWDTVLYYYENEARFDDFDEIVSVEEPIYMLVGFNNVPLLKIRCTLDLHAKKDGRHYIVDHKTTGDVEQNTEFLALDIQPRVYALTLRNLIEDEVTVCMNYVSREVPPGFGKRSLLTETGNKRSADTLAKMQRKERYLQRKWLTYSPQQYDEQQRELVRDAMMIELETKTEIWPRRIVKMGGMACSSCPYFEICKAEYDGRYLTDAAPLIQSEYTFDNKAKSGGSVIVLPGKHPFAV